MRIGLATHHVRADNVISSAVALACSIVNKIPPGALGVAKQQLSHRQPLDWQISLPVRPESLPQSGARGSMHSGRSDVPIMTSFGENLARKMILDM